MIDLPQSLDNVELAEHRSIDLDRLEQGFANVTFPFADQQSVIMNLSFVIVVALLTATCAKETPAMPTPKTPTRACLPLPAW